MSNLIFETVHGSRLYGLATADSDKDIFYVTESSRRRARHHYSRELGLDQVRVGLSTFLRRVQEGSHQSVEALFSPYKNWYRPEYRDMLEGYRVTGSGVFAKYERTIKGFCYGDFKMRRHAVRLANNLADLREFGRFNPSLDQGGVAVCNLYATRYAGDGLRNLLLGY